MGDGAGVVRMTNVPGTLPDPENMWRRLEWEADEARNRALADAEPLASLLGEQLLVLQRIERSLETLMTLANRQTTALEVIENIMDDVAYHQWNGNE